MFNNQRWSWSIWLLLLIVFLVLRYTDFYTQSPILLTMGRLHPVVLHFPLALLVVVLGLHSLRFFTNINIPDRFISIAYRISLFFIALTIPSGFLLHAHGSYEGMIVDQHYSGALWTYFLVLMAYLLFYFKEKHRLFDQLSFVFLLGTNAAALYTGHQGGSITHGTNFLTEYIPMIKHGDNIKSRLSDSIDYLFEDMLQPILESKCAGCHHTIRAEGGFSVASQTELFKTGESGRPGVVRAFPDSSEMYKRIVMPDTVDGHMPPVGKLPMARKEIDLLKYWIRQGAPKQMPIVDMPDSIRNTLVGQLITDVKKYRFDLVNSQLTKEEIAKNLLDLAGDLEVVIKQDSMSGGALYILSNRFPPVTFTAKKLQELKPYLHLFSKASFSSSDLDDADLYFISNMTNLKELYLQKTKIQGHGLKYLKRLPQLEVLNLSFTGADDKILLELLQFPTLKQLYLYGTKVNYSVIKAAKAYKPELNIHTEEGPYF